MMIHSFIVETFCENVLFTKDCLSQNLDFPLKQFRKPSTIAASSRKMRSFQFENSKTVYLWKFISKAAPFPSPPFKGFFGRNFFHWFSIAAFIIIIPISYAARLKNFTRIFLEKRDSSFEKLLWFLLDHALITKSWKSSYVVFPQRRRRTNNVVCD